MDTVTPIEWFGSGGKFADFVDAMNLAIMSGFGIPRAIVENWPMTQYDWLFCDDPAKMYEQVMFWRAHMGDNGMYYPSNRKLEKFILACRRLADQGSTIPILWLSVDLAGVLACFQTWTVIDRWDSYVSLLERARLLRHVVGNPYLSPLAETCEACAGTRHATWREPDYRRKPCAQCESRGWNLARGGGMFSSAIKNMASALIDGVDVKHALHDALLESDHVTLAKHFVCEHRGPDNLISDYACLHCYGQSTEEHVDGCWAVDFILGRE